MQNFLRVFYGSIALLGVLLGSAQAGDFIALETLAGRCDGVVSYGGEGTVGTLRGGGLDFRCHHNSARYRLNGVHVYGQCPVAGVPGNLRVDCGDWERVLVPLLAPPAISPLRRICIDPGHGGKDSGARGGRMDVLEKNLTLDVSRRLGKLLATKNIEVIFTRENDATVSLERRSEIANRGGCDLFISIHFNAADSSSAGGIETYILPSQGMASTARLQKIHSRDREFCPNNRHDEKNLYLGYCLQRGLCGLKLTKDRGLKRGRFRVLETANCPAALVECGFLTHPQECQRISSAEYRQSIAQALCDGICAYAGLQ